MLSSLVKQTLAAYSDLVDAKVLLTGVGAGPGSALALAFARAGARLLVQAAAPSPAVRALMGGLAEAGMEPSVDTRAFGAADAARFARDAARSSGGLDAAANVVTLSALDRDRAIARGDAEEAVHDLLLPASLITRVTANRMRVLYRQGSILNVLVLPFAATRADAAFASFARAALAAMTRLEAREFASSGIRVNAICRSPVPGRDFTAVASDEDIAALALFLASRKARTISGHVLDAAGATRRRC